MTEMRKLFVVAALMLCCAATHPVTAQELIPRIPLPKPASVTIGPFDGGLIVRFRDELKVRAAGGNITSLVGGDLSAVQAVQTQYGLTLLWLYP